MTAVITDSRFWTALRKEIDDEIGAGLSELRKRLSQDRYLALCGRIDGLEHARHLAEDIVKRINNDTLED